ncbi:ATP-binding protein [Microbacterium sp. 1P10UB]|uniref:sensor histidine kinase n=1 Tax=unclassified Microbacterium TaxID=2609290 RepID=UPI0039A15985
MAARTRRSREVGSAASRVFLALCVAGVLIAGAMTALLLFESQRAVRAEAERVTAAVASALAASPDVAGELADDPDPTAVLQPVAVRVIAESRVDFVTIMTVDGIRVTHRDPAQIGLPYIGTIPSSPVALTEEFTGTLGPSVRTIVPVRADGRQVGWVAVGVTIGSISSAFLARLPIALVIAVAVVTAGVAGALLARRVTRRVTGDLPAGAVRDALSSYESLRTLGEALRAQTHEHGNRAHTAVALIELGRTDEAVQILTATSRRSQELIDQVNARRAGDPTVGALLLGKASQAAERGIDWTADISPDAPSSVLAPIDQVAVVGNLIDNALDAAAAGPLPRWVRVGIAPGPLGIALTVSDSGDGVPDELREKVFEHGFSTKPAGAEGRGVGLALVRSLVEDAGGTLELSTTAPTTFHADLPARSMS